MQVETLSCSLSFMARKTASPRKISARAFRSYCSDIVAVEPSGSFRQLNSGAPDLGFVSPKRSPPRPPAWVRFAKSLFALHRSGSFRQNVPGVVGAERANARGIEGTDRGPAARPGAPLVTVERAEFFAPFRKDATKPRQIPGLSVVAIFGTPVCLAVEQPVARLPHPAKIDLRRGDPQRQRPQQRVRAV